MSKLATIEKLEKRFKYLKIEIIDKLQKIKWPADSSPPFAKITSKQTADGESMLILDAYGRWRCRHTIYYEYLIENPSVNNLLEEYAVIADPHFRNLSLKGAKMEFRKSYLKAMRLRLLRGFIQAMEKALAEIPEKVFPKNPREVA